MMYQVRRSLREMERLGVLQCDHVSVIVGQAGYFELILVKSELHSRAWTVRAVVRMPEAKDWPLGSGESHWKDV